jgi:hypothetical protein
MSLLSRLSALQVAALIVGGVGGALGLAGVAVVWYMPGIIAAEHARLAALPAPGAISLTDTPAGREVIVEGRIAPDQPRLFRDFVAYVKEEERRDRRDSDDRQWKEVERRTPPLRIEADGGTIAVVNATYGLIWAKTQWRDTARVIDTHYSGLVAGEPVFARGRAAAGGLEAIVVGSGSRDAYLAQVAGNAGVAWWLGTGLAIVGAICLTVAGVLLTVAWRTSRPRRSAPPAAR